MKNSPNSLILALALIAAGILAFFLLLYLTGHDPDERPLTLTEWVIGGALIGPGFGYLLKLRNTKDGSTCDHIVFCRLILSN